MFYQDKRKRLNRKPKERERDERLSVASQGQNQDENIVEEKDISAPDHELLSVEKSKAAEDVSQNRLAEDEAIIPQKETVVREQVNEEKSEKEKPTAGRPSSSRVAYTKSSIPLKVEQRSSFAIDISPSRKGHLIGQPRNDVSSSATCSSLVNLASKTESSRDVTKSVPSQVLRLSSRPSSAPLVPATGHLLPRS
ncbi:hypothetical protein MLD38_008125 [Melastoma candidum]|uniref:Uncharacterized protein n=1 Tax=Melastoma candidum TaxID=119954 RepID=A0ACB9RT97_9MYRT|nr:hypothetical protein MLD38_008125 [Melastoma candidum]